MSAVKDLWAEFYEEARNQGLPVEDAITLAHRKMDDEFTAPAAPDQDKESAE